jgi:hypothetical protein
LIKGFGRIWTRNLKSRILALCIRLSYEAEKMEGTRGFEPPTCSFARSRAKFRLRHVPIKIWILDFGLRIEIKNQNPKLNWRKVEDSNPYMQMHCSFRDCCHTGLAYLPKKFPVWLEIWECGFRIYFNLKLAIPNPKSKCEVWRNHVFLPKGLGGNLAGAFRFELKTPVLETGVLPIETTRL